MFIKRSISLVVIPVLLSLSAGVGIAQADDINVRNGDTKISIGDDGDIKVRQPGQRINVDDDGDIKVRDNGRRSNSGWWNQRIISFPSTRRSVTCRGGTYSSQSTRTSSSGGGYSRTSSSTTTCR
jgi:hypothetical protein